MPGFLHVLGGVDQGYMSNAPDDQNQVPPPPPAPHSRGYARRQLGVAALAALGVVFGDLGTSPLYALHDTFVGSHPVAVTRDNVLGILSLFVWSLVIVVSGKYLTLLMRADNRGEGGIFALLGLTGAASVK